MVKSYLEAPGALEDAREAKRRGADLVEWRIDAACHAALDPNVSEVCVAALRMLVNESPLPCILTCRVAAEGGDFEGSELDRMAVLRRLVAETATPPRYLDVEWSSYSRSSLNGHRVDELLDRVARAGDLSTSLIVSMHDFSGRPSDLLRRVLAMRDAKCAVVKVACRARSLHDSLEILSLAGQLGKPTIALAMGEFGVMSRVLARKFGGFLTFASLREEAATAPGQPTLDELVRHYHFREINERTSVYGVIGYPVTHSQSPLVHNAAFRGAGVNSVYVPMPISAYEDPAISYASFRAMVLELIEHPALDFCGASVTMPHKEHLARLASERGWTSDISAIPMGAANTLTVRRDALGRVVGCEVRNTDVAAFATLFLGTVGGASAVTGDVLSGATKALASRHIGIVGAGGAAKAAAFAAVLMGAKVTIFNRDSLRAASVVASLRSFAENSEAIATGQLEDIELAGCDTFVQATPVGMTGHQDVSLLPISIMRHAPEETTLIETVYSPIDTRAVRDARRAGWRVLDGAALFVEQAALQAEAWLGDKAGAIDLRTSFESMVRFRLSQAAQ